MDYLNLAIQRLKPNSEYVYFGDDYSTIRWMVLDGAAPSESEIQEAIEQVKADEIAEATAKAQARADLLNRLGITSEEAKLLLQ